MQLQFNVNQQIISLENTDVKVVADSKNYLDCKFSFSEEWKDKLKTAIFISASGDAFCVILEDDVCAVPWEVIQHPYFNVSVFGGDLITANKATVNVIKSGYCKGKTPTAPTPDVYSQIIKLIEEMGGEIDEEVIKQAVEEYLKNNPTEVDPTVPEWAKQPNKPKYTSDEVGTYSSLQLDERMSKKANKSDIYTKEETEAYVEGQTEIIRADILSLNDKVLSESHFRGYFLKNSDLDNLVATPNDFAYSAESGTKWVYTKSEVGGYVWDDTAVPVPDQLTPASDTPPLMDGEASVGKENAYARGDHRHPTDTTRVSVVEFNAFKSELETALDNIIEKYGLDGGTE